MIPKPKILKGEVKEFITILDKLASQTLGYGEVMKFYSQPFKPEMITEYFEGWEKQEELSGDFHRESIWIYERWGEQICDNDNCLWINGEPCISLPKTLSQFITNCIQAGIELQWKE